MLSAGNRSHAVGRYVVCDRVAAGGMATVHLGKLLGPVGFSRIVALKRLHPQFAREPAFVAMFVDEARLAARIRHPNVVPTLDVVSTEDELVLVMEYVHGESLSRLWKNSVASGKALPPALVASVAVGALQGLHAAHEATTERGEPLHLVHRDVSPQNILVGVDGVTRVVDFGVAKAVGRVQTTQEGQTKGKLAYMSPEQARSLNVDRRTDVYATAVVLWELLTGRRLFQGDDPKTLISQVLTRDVEPPSYIVPTLPSGIDEIVLRGLARDPEERFATALEMALALERAVAPMPSREVGRWVETTAGEELLARTQLVQRIERGEDAPSGAGGPRALTGRSSLVETEASPVPSDDAARAAPPEPSAGGAPKPRSKRREWPRALWSGVIVLSIVGAATMGYAMSRAGRTEALPAPSAPPSTPPIGIAVAASSALGTAPAAPSPAPPPPSAPPALAIAPPTLPSVAASPVPPPRSRNIAPRQSHASPSCDVPFVVDADGFRHPRPECLRLSPAKR